MDSNAIQTAVSTIGYPIVTGLICMYYIREQNKSAREEREKTNESLAAKIEELNVSITKLITLLHTMSGMATRKGVEYDDYGD